MSTSRDVTELDDGFVWEELGAETAWDVTEVSFTSDVTTSALIESRA